MRKYLFPTAKFLLAFFLVIWMISSDRLSLNNLGQAFQNWQPLVLGISSVIVIVFLSIFRWHLLLRTLGINILLSITSRLSLISLFFSTFVPGAVTGDVVKAYYISMYAPHQVPAGIMSIGLDRLLGVCCLFPMALWGIWDYWPRIAASRQLSFMAAFLITATFVLLVFLPILMSTRVKNNRTVLGILSKLPFSITIQTMYDALHMIKYQKRAAAEAVLTSLMVPILLGVAFYCFGLALGVDNIRISAYIFLMPFVILSMAIPLTPGGIGIGQVVALGVMELLLGIRSSYGADLVTLMQLSRFLIAFPGVLIYIGFRLPEAELGKPGTGNPDKHQES